MENLKTEREENKKIHVQWQQYKNHINPIWVIVSLLHPLKRPETSGFMFSWVIKRKYWCEMDYCIDPFVPNAVNYVKCSKLTI